MSRESWEAQKRGWLMLNALRPVAIDLSRIALLRETSLDVLSNCAELELLLQQLGLNDEGAHEFPSHLREYCGRGLRLWQYPNQFSKYLIRLSTLGITSYLEIGIRHGGSFVATAEYVSRFAPLERAVAIDIIPCPSMTEYERVNPRASFYQYNTQSIAFSQFLKEQQAFDLAFIDSHHEEPQCRRELLWVQQNARMIALHDICNVGCPGIRKVWEEFKTKRDYTCFEYVDQYLEDGPYMGIGLALKRER
jgi:hypothetical protein